MGVLVHKPLFLICSFSHISCCFRHLCWGNIDTSWLMQ